MDVLLPLLRSSGCQIHKGKTGDQTGAGYPSPWNSSGTSILRSQHGIVSRPNRGFANIARARVQRDESIWRCHVAGRTCAHPSGRRAGSSVRRNTAQSQCRGSLRSLDFVAASALRGVRRSPLVTRPIAVSAGTASSFADPPELDRAESKPGDHGAGSKAVARERDRSTAPVNIFSAPTVTRAAFGSRPPTDYSTCALLGECWPCMTIT